LIQALAGIVIALIALLSSYDHISLWFIVASMALVVVDAQLATGSRLRAAHDAARAEDEAAEERNRAAEERERAARRAQRQARCDLVQLRHQLNPSAFHTRQARDVIALLEEYGEFS
jgi:hypothetical protein